MSLPDLPLVPKFPKRLTSSELDGSVVSSSNVLAVQESKDLVSLLADRDAGRPLVVSAVSPLGRYHGCRRCPHYGSTFCFLKIVPPNLFDGVCVGRLNEILDIVVRNGSADGLRICKQESIDRLGKLITVLENNLSDYSLKRFERSKDLSSKPLRDSDGDIILSDHPEARSASAERDLKLAQFDSYQLRLLDQINSLSADLVELLQSDAKLVSNEKIAASLSPLSLGRLIRESRVIDI